MKCAIRQLSLPSKNERGSMTVEAIISVTTLLLLIFIMSASLKTMQIYENMDHCINESAKKLSAHEGYVFLTSSNGMSEQYARPLLLKGLLLKEMKAADLIITKHSSVINPVEFHVEELGGYDKEDAIGTYKISYKVPMPGKLPAHQYEHQVRIKALWSFGDAFDEMSESESIIVYTSTRGRQEKIYHTHADCWTLKGSWKNPDSVETVKLEMLDAYRVCKICEKRESKEEQNVN